MTKKSLKDLSKEELENIAAQYLDDDEIKKWENGELGTSIEHSELSNRTIQTSIRLDKLLILDLKALAKEDGLDSYQTYIKRLLKKHVNNKKKQKKAI